MKIITFSARLRKNGLIYTITVPARYIKDGHVKEGETYKVTLEEEGEK